jgi:hypothetical protein
MVTFRLFSIPVLAWIIIHSNGNAHTIASEDRDSGTIAFDRAAGITCVKRALRPTRIYEKYTHLPNTVKK